MKFVKQVKSVTVRETTLFIPFKTRILQNHFLLPIYNGEGIPQIPHF